MNQTAQVKRARAVEESLSLLQKRLLALNSAELGRVVEKARAGRTAVWNLRKGKRNIVANTVIRIEQAVTYVEQQREVPTP